MDGQPLRDSAEGAALVGREDMTRRSIIANAAGLFMLIHDSDLSPYPPRTMRIVKDGVVVCDMIWDEATWNDWMPETHSIEEVDGVWRFWKR
jgi:hypothetical protein